MTILHENKTAKWERCLRCGKYYRFNKGYKGRIANAEYLKAHVRSFCQKWGVTKRVYMNIYQPQKCIISI